jgi:hypothetical protein
MISIAWSCANSCAARGFSRRRISLLQNYEINDSGKKRDQKKKGRGLEPQPFDLFNALECSYF